MLVLGLTYKPNVSDIRTSAICRTIEHLKKYDVNVVGHDPHADHDAIRAEFEIEVASELNVSGYDAVIVGAAHDDYMNRDVEIMIKEFNSESVLVDTEGIFEHKVDGEGVIERFPHQRAG